MNPFDLGFVNNWKLFLGFNNLQQFITKVILPSRHKPVGDGVNWYDYINYGPKLKQFQHDIIQI